MPDLTRRRFLAAASAAVAGAAAPRLFATEDRPVRPNPNPVAAGVNRFSLDLYRQLQADRGNVFASPFSVSTALAMTAAGARGATLDEMVKVLHLPTDPAATDAGFRALLGRMNGDRSAKRPYQLSTANAIWAQKGYPWRPEFKDRVAGNYGAGLFDADFAAAPEPARRTINAWVEKETHDKIKELLAKGMIDRLTVLVLTNAIYFKGDWAAKFDPKLTAVAPFAAADGTSPPARLMHRRGEYGYAEPAPGLQLLELPYAGGELAMLVVLPREVDGLDRVAKSLSAETLDTWVKALRPRPVKAYLPRFKMEAKYVLNDPLKALGMKAAFGAADFSGMTTSGEPLSISLVVHQAYVDVNEEGTEAAAATGVVVLRAAAPAPREPVVFRADRPFLFLIRDVTHGTVLFLGRLTDPTK
jgi:serpin B